MIANIIVMDSRTTRYEFHTSRLLLVFRETQGNLGLLAADFEALMRR